MGCNLTRILQSLNENPLIKRIRVSDKIFSNWYRKSFLSDFSQFLNVWTALVAGKVGQYFIFKFMQRGKKNIVMGRRFFPSTKRLCFPLFRMGGYWEGEGEGGGLEEEKAQINVRNLGGLCEICFSCWGWSVGLGKG